MGDVIRVIRLLPHLGPLVAVFDGPLKPFDLLGQFDQPLLLGPDDREDGPGGVLDLLDVVRDIHG